MRTFQTAALALTAAGFAGSASAVTLLSEDFESDGNGTRYTTSTPEFSDGFGDFFTRTDGSTIGTFIEYAGATGSYFAASDIDGEGADQRQTLTFSGIDITGLTNLTLSLDAAEDDDGDNQDWDEADLVHASFVIDGAAPDAFATGYAIWFDSNPIGDDNDSNQAPFLNFDFDADGGDSPEDTEVTSTFATFSRDLGFDSTDGSIIDLVITFDLNSGDEDFAIDNITLTGDVVPEPASLALVGLGTATLLGRRRRRSA